VSFGLLLAGFLATTNAGRVALAAGAARPRARGVAVATAVGAVLVVAGVLLADALLDALSISPESFRIAAGVILAATGIKTLVAPQPVPGPFAAILVTPELLAMAVSAGSSAGTGTALAAAAVAFAALTLTLRPWNAATTTRTAHFLAAVQIVVAVALAVTGVRDV
jgi:hypothetical protein